MATKGTKTQELTVSKKTVLQLKPIQYQVEMVYLGEKHIKKDGSYNCEFTVDDGTTAVASQTTIKNLVSGTPSGDDAKAAKRIADGGKSNAPSTEESRRILITDNHTPRLADKATADNFNVLDYYDAKGWMKDIKPAVPFRVVVRRFVGDVQIPVKDDLKVLVELKDPPEEFDQTDGRPKAFMENFFKKYNHASGTASVGDDNQQTWGLGTMDKARAHPGQEGVKAVNVVKKMPFKKWEMGDDLVTFSELGAAAEEAVIGALLTPEKKEEGTSDKNDVFVADFAFTPFPALGDNYRFLLTVRNGSDDVRKKKENGAEPKLIDSAKAEITSPHGYLTGKFTLWKKTFFKLIVLVNGLTKTAVDWSLVQAKYKKVFIHVEAPTDSTFYTITEDQWIQNFKAHFDPAGTIGKYTGKWKTDPSNDYDKNFYPPFLHSECNDGNTHPLSRALLKLACSKATPAITHPYSGGDDAQTAVSGHFVVMMRHLSPSDGDLGEFLFDRHQNVMVQGVTAVQQVRTIAHEIGHALTLRHAFTQTQSLKVNGAACNLIYHNEAAYQARYHDPKHTLECIMGYTGVDDAQFCGICSLILRWYPVFKVVDSSNYGADAMKYYEGGAIMRLAPSNDDVLDLTAAFPVAVNSTVRLLALGPEQDYNPRWSDASNIAKGRVVLTTLPGATWTQSGTGSVTLTASGPFLYDAKGKTAGDVEIKCSVHGMELKCTLKVNP